MQCRYANYYISQMPQYPYCALKNFSLYWNKFYRKSLIISNVLSLLLLSTRTLQRFVVLSILKTDFYPSISSLVLIIIDAFPCFISIPSVSLQIEIYRFFQISSIYCKESKTAYRFIFNPPNVYDHLLQRGEKLF